MDRKHLGVVIAVIGLGLGAFSHASSGLPGPWRWIGNFGALWVAVAFFAGRLADDIRRGSFAGAASLAVASVIHYVPHRVMLNGFSSQAFRWPVGLWVVVGIAVGLLFGGLGAAHAQHMDFFSNLGVALLAAIFAAEALVLFRIGHERAVQVAVPIEALAALTLPLLLLDSVRDRVRTYLVALALVPLGALGLAAFMGVIHRVYPGI
jgi:hypothetical protein